MAFDDDLRRTFDRLTDQVRAELDRQLEAAATELSSAVEAERTAARAQAADAAEAERARAEQEVADRIAAATAAASAAATAAANEAAEAARVDAEREAEARGRATGREEGRAEGHEIGRAEGLRDGLAQGREEVEQAAHAAQAAQHTRRSADASAAERLADAVRAIDRAKSLTEILDTLVSCAGREAPRAGVVLATGAQLRGWRFLGFGDPLDEHASIEITTAAAGIVGDAIRNATTVSTATAPEAVAPAFADLRAGADMVAAPVVLGGQVVAVVYADQGPGRQAATDGAAESVQWRVALEVMARHAARSLEAITALRAAQVLTDRTESSAADDETARRYAKLLVSEIKLYHEPEVLAGRRERDLATRLGGEIARARVLYEQRVPVAARRASDHFHAELVRMLADGDATLLEAGRP